MAVKIIILHGWSQDKGLWQDLAYKLGKKSKAIDLPGFGKEKIINSNWGVPDYAKWVEDKIKQKEDKIILIGHSFGGRIAAEIASHKPEWLKGLILSGAPCIYRPDTKTKAKIILSKIAKLVIPRSFQGKYLPKDLKKAKKMGLETTFRKTVIYDQTKNLRKINVPTLLIWGENDVDAPIRISYEINKLINKSQLKIIDGAGHNSFLENPNLFYSYVKKFTENIK
ncbi:MAG: alpha/beta hydrolase [Microgenomates group bacterium]